MAVTSSSRGQLHALSFTETDHGWRAFAGEVAIIVLGVGIALVAEQAVEAWNWRSEADDARAALRAEISIATGDVKARVALTDCVIDRADGLEKWLTSYRSQNERTPKGAIGRPPSNPPISQA